MAADNPMIWPYHLDNVVLPRESDRAPLRFSRARLLSALRGEETAA